MTVSVGILRVIACLALPAAITTVILASLNAWADVDDRPSPIDVVCPKHPAAVPADGNLVLAY